MARAAFMSTGNKRGPKHQDPDVRDEVVAEIVKLARRGYSQTAISHKVGLSQPMISIHLKRVSKENRELLTIDRESWVAEKLAELQSVREQAWEAWEASRQDFQREQVELIERVPGQQGQQQQQPGGKGNKAAGSGQRPRGDGQGAGHRKLTRVKEGRLPAAAYLQIVLQTIKDERELLGLDAPKQLEAKVAVVDWDAVAADAMAEPRDRVEDRLQELLANPVTPLLGDQGREPPKVVEPVQANGNGQHGKNDKSTKQ